MARTNDSVATKKLIVEIAANLFIENGYDNTSIQDIISGLNGLSKGAVYYHFKSKEEIFEAVCDSHERNSVIYFDSIKNDGSINGAEKLKIYLSSINANPNNKLLRVLAQKMLNEPRFLSMHIQDMFTIIVPEYVEPVIIQCVEEGSIQTEHPRELAELIMCSLNIWMNPLINKMTPEQMRKKVLLFRDMLFKLGVNIDIFDDKLIDDYASLAEYMNE